MCWFLPAFAATLSVVRVPTLVLVHIMGARPREVRPALRRTLSVDEIFTALSVVSQDFPRDRANNSGIECNGEEGFRNVAHYSTLAPGLQVGLVIGSHEWSAVVRARLPDHIYLEPLQSNLTPRASGQTGILRWSQAALVWELGVHLQALPEEPQLVRAEPAGRPQAVERRQARRFPWHWPVTVQWGRWPRRHIQGVSEDLSVAGCRCRLSERVNTSPDYWVTLVSPSQRWVCHARLLREPAAGNGGWTTVFVWLPDKATEVWQQWIAKQG